MGRVLHMSAVNAARFIYSQCIRSVILHRRRSEIRGPFIIACTHVSHLEPVIVSCLMKRNIDWMARIEFFRHPAMATFLRGMDAFSVNRQGVPVSAIRKSIERLKQGKIVGIFPEGGVVARENAMFRGGPMKLGVCVIAQRAGVPVLPVVILGTEKLTEIEPWLPMRRARIWVNFGRPVLPVIPNPHRAQRRAARQALAINLQREFTATYHELCQTCNLEESASL